MLIAYSFISVEVNWDNSVQKDSMRKQPSSMLKRGTSTFTLELSIIIEYCA